MTKASGRSSTFIYGLSNSYSEFKGFYENKSLEFPDSLDSAFTEASTYRVNRSDHRVKELIFFLPMAVLGEGIKGEESLLRMQI